MGDDHGNPRARVALIEGAGVDAPSLPASLVDLWQRALIALFDEFFVGMRIHLVGGRRTEFLDRHRKGDDFCGLSAAGFSAHAVAALSFFKRLAGQARFQILAAAPAGLWAKALRT